MRPAPAITPMRRRDWDQVGRIYLGAGIFPENEASLAVHRRCGFRIVGRRERIGRHRGTWRDVCLLERRSPKIG